MNKIRLLPIKDIDAALRAYYGSGYIGNKEIGEIFGTTSSSTVAKLKKPVQDAEREADKPIVVPHHVSVETAFEVWGIDVAKLEHNREKLKKLQLG